jgi:O-antigen/teichoic acid export membrane protein
MKRLKITGKILARNTILNFIGRSLPLFVGVITIPFIVRGLGEERFGLLSLIWIVLGYFSIFDLGLGRATTKYVAEALGKGKTKQIAEITWTAITVQALFGVIGTVIILIGSPLLTERILKISPLLTEEAISSFRVLAFSVPIVLIASSFSAVLEATQRFDLINAVKIPASIMTFIIPLIGVQLHLTLPSIIMLILFTRFGTLIAFAFLVFYITPQMKKYICSIALFPRLLSFGGWVAISNIIGPVLQYLDRFLIGAVLTVSVVAFYTAPFDAISRLWIIPGSMVMTIFPAFSSIGTAYSEDLKYFFLRASKYIFFILTLIVLPLIIFAHDILKIWLGNSFAENSTTVLQVLSLGILVSSLTHITLALFQGIGRPDVTVKIQTALLPVSLILTYILIKHIGIIGAAISWTFCRIAGMLLSWRVAWRLVRLEYKHIVKNKLNIEFAWFLLFTISLTPVFFINDLLFKFLGAVTVYIIFIYFGWQRVFDIQDRSMMVMFFKKLIRYKQLNQRFNNIKVLKKR